RVFRIQRAPVRRLRGGQQFRRRLRRLGLVGEGRAAGGGERESEDRGQAAGKRHRAAPWRWPPILPQVGDQDFFLPPPSCLLTVAQAIRSAVSWDLPSFFSLASMCRAWRFCLSV